MLSSSNSSRRTRALPPPYCMPPNIYIFGPTRPDLQHQQRIFVLLCGMPHCHSVVQAPARISCPGRMLSRERFAFLHEVHTT